MSAHCCIKLDLFINVIMCELTVAVKWELTGNWPVQSKCNYPKLKFIPFDMEHQFGDTEISGIWREKILFTSFWMQITTHSKVNYERRFLSHNVVSDVLVYCQQKRTITDDPGSKPDQI